jgi:tripeptidyl-peptidase-1
MDDEAVVGEHNAPAVPFEADLPGAPPPAWRLDTSWRVLPGEPITVTVALKQEGVAAMLRELDAVSDPTNSRSYGQHWSPAQMRERVFAPAAAHAAVVAWLVGSGAAVGASSPNRALVDATFAAADAERAFGVRLGSFVHARTGRRALRAVRLPHAAPYSLPHEVASLVDLVDGIAARFNSFDARAPHQRDDDDGAFQVTPASLKARYGVEEGAVPRNPANLQAVASFLGQFFSPEDLAAFQKQNGLAPAPVARVVGPQNGSNPGVEAELDVQFLSGVANGTSTVVWSTEGERPGGNEPFLTWLNALETDAAAGHPMPNVFSISYQDYEDTVSAAFMGRVDAEFAKLGMLGVTVVTGSGDWGVGCAADGATFRPDFPSSSPHIVSTGATTLAGAGTAADAEVGVKFSSGGFSNVFAQPSFQAAAVRRFLAQTPVPASSFNASGRAFPDVSTLGVNFRVVVRGETENVGGTSAATPTFAALVSLLNDARLNAGQPTMGWILPFLYHAAAVTGGDDSAFTDVTSGNNGFKTCAGFDCAPGWDPMTGLGTPRFAGLLKHAMQVAR